MKRIIKAFCAVLMMIALAACGGTKDAGKTDSGKTNAAATDAGTKENGKEWSRTGYFADENENLLNIMKSEEEEYPGWYVGVLLEEDMYGWYIQQEGDALKGNIVPEYEEGQFVVTVTEEGEDGVLLKTENGKEYHFTPTEIEEADIGVTINTEGLGEFTAVSDAEDAFESEEGTSSMILSLYEPTTYTLTAVEIEDWKFVKWTKDGKDYSTEKEITVEFTESAEFVAVFEYPEQEEEQ
jgi:hypothetical protein